METIWKLRSDNERVKEVEIHNNERLSYFVDGNLVEVDAIPGSFNYIVNKNNEFIGVREIAFSGNEEIPFNAYFV